MKTHLQANGATAIEAFAFCASKLTAAGKVRHNARRSYTTMGSPIVLPSAFIETAAADRCAHCVDVLRQRRAMFPKTFAAVCQAA
jgi:hypothetical protein